MKYDSVPDSVAKSRLVKVDGRYRGHESFRWMLDFYRNQLGYLKVREWCWETWGASEELELWEYVYYRPETRELANPNWSWLYDANPVTLKIYLRDDSELAWYKLRWR
jgi:hypothetical protein